MKENFGRDVNLIKACLDGNSDEVSSIISGGADVNCGSGMPLKVAVSSGKLDVVKILIQNEDIIYEGNSELLGIAYSHKHFEVFDYLISKGLSINEEEIISEDLVKENFFAA